MVRMGYLAMARLAIFPVVIFDNHSLHKSSMIVPICLITVHDNHISRWQPPEHLMSIS